MKGQFTKVIPYNRNWAERFAIFARVDATANWKVIDFCDSEDVAADWVAELEIEHELRFRLIALNEATHVVG